MMSLVEQIFIASIAIVLIPWVLSKLVPENFAPLAVIQIVGGIILGPSLLGATFPAVYSSVFSPQALSALTGLSILAVTLFASGIGHELELKKEHIKFWPQVLATLAIPAVTGWVLSPYLLTWFNLNQEAGIVWNMTVALGVSIAAIPIMGVVLRQLGIIKTKLGQDILAIALFTDAVVWTALTVFLWYLDLKHIHWAWSIVYIVLQFVLARPLLNFFNQFKSLDVILLVYILVSGLLADVVGIHFIFGGFIAGILIPKDMYNEHIQPYQPAVMTIMMPFFFLLTGLRTDMGDVAFDVFGLALVLLMLSGIGKIIGLWITKYSFTNAWQSGWILQTKGLMDIVLASVLYDHKIISSTVFAALIMYAIISTLITTPIVRPTLKKIR